MEKSSSSEKNIRNTFASHCDNEYLSVSDIIMGLKFSVFKWEKLPEDIQDRVTAKLESKTIPN